jgi:hypothetical protein
LLRREARACAGIDLAEAGVVAQARRSTAVSPTKAHGLARDVRASVTAEYVIVVGTVSLVVTGALIGIGPKLVSAYVQARNVLAQPLP